VPAIRAYSLAHVQNDAEDPKLHLPAIRLTIILHPIMSSPLDGSVVSDWRNALWCVVLCADCPGLSWHHWLSLQVDVDTVGLRLLLECCVALDTSKELVSRSRLADVLNSDVDALLDVSVSDLTVQDDSNGGLGDIVDNTGLAVIHFVWHTLLNGSVGDNIDDISDLVLFEVSRQRDHSTLLEVPAEGIASTRT